MKYFSITPICFIVFLSACISETENNLNLQASLNKTEGLTVNPLLENVITSSINPKAGTMQILYGNKIAWDYVNTHTDLQYPKGSVLYSVTWRQKPDSLWFGANIPKEIVQIEQVSFENEQPKYERFQGSPLQKTDATDSSRLAYILSQKMAISP